MQYMPSVQHLQYLERDDTKSECLLYDACSHRGGPQNSTVSTKTLLLDIWELSSYRRCGLPVFLRQCIAATYKTHRRTYVP